MKEIVGFNEQYYLDANIDIRKAIKSELFQSGIEHLEKHGLKEIKQGIRKFHSNYAPYHEAFYLQSFSDIRRMIEKRKFSSGFEHFCLFGYNEIISGLREWKKTPINRAPSPERKEDVISITNFIKKVRFLTEDNQEPSLINLENINIYKLKELEELSDEHFIDFMYQIALERIADVDGKNNKLLQLKSGKKRKDIIVDMRNSDEGRKYIDNHIILGINNYGSTIDERLLYKSEYNYEDFCNLIAFYKYKFSAADIPKNIINVLSYSGSEFVYLLYMLILKREPDFEGFNVNIKFSYLLEDKLIKIYDFTHSNEASAKKTAFNDLSNDSISQLASHREINYTTLSKENFNKLKNLSLKMNSSEITFHELFNGSILRSIITITELTSQPLTTFKKICNAIFKKQKTILEVIYDYEILSQINKHVRIIDYFNKQLIQGSVSENDLLRNIQYFISDQQSRKKNLIYNFNLNSTYKNIESDIIELSKLTNIMAHKKDINTLHSIDKKIIQEIKNSKEILKEHEESILKL